MRSVYCLIAGMLVSIAALFWLLWKYTLTTILVSAALVFVLYLLAPFKRKSGGSRTAPPGLLL